jgi:hypothetical protein
MKEQSCHFLPCKTVFVKTAHFWDITQHHVVVVYNYNTMQGDIPEECRSHQHRSRSLKSKLCVCDSSRGDSKLMHFIYLLFYSMHHESSVVRSI